MSRKPLSTTARIWVLVGLILVFLAGTFYLLARDIPAFDDSDLARSPSVLDPSQNPFPEIREISLTPEHSAQVQAAWKAFLETGKLDAEEVLRLREELAIPMARFREYSQLHPWRDDQPPSIANADPHWTEWLRVTQLLQLEMERLRQSGEAAEAIDLAFCYQGFGFGLMSSATDLVSFALGSTLVSSGQKRLAQILTTVPLGQLDFTQIRERLDSLPSISSSYQNALKAEYSWQESLLGKLEESGVSSNTLLDSEIPEWLPTAILFHRNRTQLLLADFYRQSLREMASALEAETGTHLQSTAASPSSSAIRNSFGQAWVAHCTSSIEKVNENAIALEAKHRMLLLLIALLQWKEDHGSLPDSLELLVPDYLAAIPQDPFDSEPIRFAPDKGLIYSMGTDFVDDGGVPPDKPGTLESRQEIVIELEPIPEGSDDQ